LFTNASYSKGALKINHKGTRNTIAKVKLYLQMRTQRIFQQAEKLEATEPTEE